MKENIEWLATASTSMLMFGKRNSSFRLVLLRFRKSIQHLICTFFFFRGITLASQLGCWMGFMKPLFKSLCISCLICTSSSGLNSRCLLHRLEPFADIKPIITKCKWSLASQHRSLRRHPSWKRERGTLYSTHRHTNAYKDIRVDCNYSGDCVAHCRKIW